MYLQTGGPLLDLSQPHIEYLQARGITDPQVIEARGYRTVTDPQDLVARGYSDAQASHVPGLLLPIFNTTGAPAGFEYRADKPRRSGAKGKEVKFDRPYGQTPCLNTPPTVASALRQGGPFQPLVIVEGVTRADALAQRGVPSTAIMGIFGWKADSGSGPQTLSEFHELPIKGREIWIFPDGDALSNPGVNAGTRALVDVFKRRGARAVSVGVVPGGLGLDDWLGDGNDVTDLQTLLTPAQDLPMVTPSKRPGLPDTSDRDLAEEWLGTDAPVAYLPTLDSWTAFLHGRWQQDGSGNVARVSLSSYLAEAADAYAEVGDDKEAKVLKSLRKTNDVLGMAAALAQSHARDEDFDRDPWLFNCANGTLDLRTGFLRDHDPADKLRGIAPTDWDPEALASTWDKFLNEVLPDPDVRSYLQVLLGMSLVGQTVIHVLPVFVGSGRNGKGTLIHALTSVMGVDYSGPVDKSLLISTKFESHPTKLMALKGKRFVMASETEQGDRFASASLKALTGGDAITARGMRQDQQSFSPSHTMVLLTNSLPEVDALDKAMWARLKLFQFTADFEGREDRTISDRLQAERSGILGWMVAGVQRYLAEGLPQDPLGVTMATGDWRMDENSFLQFANERLIKDPKGVVASGDLIDAYTRWCQTQDVEALKARALGAAIKAWGGQERRTRVQRQWQGFSFRDGSEGPPLYQSFTTLKVSVPGDTNPSPVTEQGDGFQDGVGSKRPPVTCDDGKSNDGLTGVTQNIGVSAITSAPPTTSTTATEGPEKPVTPSSSVTQAPDQRKQGDTSLVTGSAGDGFPSPGHWNRPMPFLP